MKSTAFKFVLSKKNLNYLRITCNLNILTRSVSYENRNILRLKDRGLITNIFPNKYDELEKLLASGLQSIYCGFDPTAASLHVGNLLALITLIHCQRAGHTPISVIGSATALVGDPSGRTNERNPLDSKQIIENSKKIQENIENIFKNHENFLWKESPIYKQHKNPTRLPEAKILNNIKWYQNVNIVEFLSAFGKHIRMSDLLSRKHIQSRIKSNEGISYTEFSYQILQAYDWLHLLNNHNCRIQFGGNDQTGNIQTGYEFIDKIKPNSEVFGITLPLITTASGEKLGKSAGNAIWLDETLYSTFDFYQYFLNTSDQMVETYLKIFTFLPLNEISDIMHKHKQSPNKYVAQRKLAEQLTILVRGEEGLESAIRCTQAFFTSNVESLSSLTLTEIESIFKAVKINYLTYEKGMKILDVLIKSNIFNDIEEAVTILTNGGISINFKKVIDPQIEVSNKEHILKNNLTFIKIGKKRCSLIKWLNELDE